MPRLVGANWLLFVAASAGSIVLAESLARVHRALFPRDIPPPRVAVGERPNRPSHNFVFDSVTGWRMKPGRKVRVMTAEGYWTTYRSNAAGFRANRDVLPDGPRKRIIVTGDSFTWGTGVEYDETYGALVEARLSGSVVDNLAMPGFGLDQMWMSVRHQALPQRPALVIVGFIDDDFDRSLTAYRVFEGINKPLFVLEGGRLRPASAADRANALVRQLERHSVLWQTGRLTVRRLAYTVPIGAWWSVNRAILAAIKSDADERGVPILFLRLPTWEFERHRRPEQFPTLRAFMQGQGANYLDLEASHPPPTEILFPKNGHMNRRGHAWVAERIMEWIAGNLPELCVPSCRPGLPQAPRPGSPSRSTIR